jgi:hypothetical protein
MGLARHKGELRLGLSATVASAVLYSAVVLFGVGSASPSALDAGGDRHPPVVLVYGQADAVSGSVLRLPQASPEPRRKHSSVRSHRPRKVVVATATPAATPGAESPPPPVPPRATESAPAKDTDSSTAAVVEPVVSVPVPALPVPELTVPTVPVPQLPVPLPELPAPPPLPLPLP